MVLATWLLVSSGYFYDSSRNGKYTYVGVDHQSSAGAARQAPFSF